jgi:hypothetical protein
VQPPPPSPQVPRPRGGGPGAAGEGNAERDRRASRWLTPMSCLPCCFQRCVPGPGHPVPPPDRGAAECIRWRGGGAGHAAPVGGLARDGGAGLVRWQPRSQRHHAERAGAPALVALHGAGCAQSRTRRCALRLSTHCPAPFNACFGRGEAARALSAARVIVTPGTRCTPSLGIPSGRKCVYVYLVCACV